MDKDRPSLAPSDPAAATGSATGEIPGAEPAEQSSPASEYLTGRLLIAMPGIDDPRFDRAVILMCVHNDVQAMGIALNRPMQGLSVPSLLSKLGLPAENVPETPVLFGGPVERERGYVVHSDDYSSPDSTLAVAAGVALTDTRDVLEALGDETRRPRRALLALGYAGWGPGQIEFELQQGVWLACEPDEALVFDDDYDSKWTRALEKLGVSVERLSTQAGRA